MKQPKLSLGAKLTALIVLTCAVLGVTSVVVSYHVFRTEMDQYYNQTAGNLSKPIGEV